MTIRDEIKQACKQAGLSVREAGKVAGIRESTIYSWTAPEGSKQQKKPLPATVLGFKILLALHVTKDAVLIEKNGAITLMQKDARKSHARQGENHVI